MTSWLKNESKLTCRHSHMRWKKDAKKSEWFKNSAQICYQDQPFWQKKKCNKNQLSRIKSIFLFQKGWKETASKKQTSNKNPQIIHKLLDFFGFFVDTYSRTGSCFHPSFWLASLYSTYRQPRRMKRRLTHQRRSTLRRNWTHRFWNRKFPLIIMEIATK